MSDDTPMADINDDTPTGLGLDRYPRIYTAGAMQWTNDEDAYWRRSIDDELDYVSFFHPTEGWTDHGGDMIDGAVSEDIQFIDAADGLVAYYSETPQIGTTVEIMHAVHTRTPVLVMLHPDLAFPGQGSRPENESGEPNHELEQVELRGAADHHWFLVNYLTGDSATATQRRTPDWITPWEGIESATCRKVAPENIPDAVADWVAETFSRPDPR